jgi:hypothetical protein
MTKYIGKVPLDKVDDDNIRCLVIAPHIHDNKIVGYFMFLHEDINKPAKWDNWFQTLDVAFEAAEAYGIHKESWQTTAL